MEKNEKGIDIISTKKLEYENIKISQMQKKEQIRNESKKQTNNKNTKKSTKKKNKKQNKKQNKLWKKIKKWLAALGIGVGVTTLAISAGEGPKINETEIEEPIEKPNDGNESKNKFINGLKKGVNVKTNKEKIKEIEGLENSEDVRVYLKDLYIEEYKNQTGDTSLTTKDIEISLENTQNYAYIIKGETEETEEIVLHGEHPYETEKKLEEQGKEYYTDDNLGTIIIVTNNDKFIDGAGTLNNKNEVYNVVEPEEKNLGIVAKDWKKYATLCDLWKTFEDPTNNEYMEGLAKENVINAITNKGNNTNEVENIIDEER